MNKKTKFERLGDIRHGAVFEFDNGIYIKLMNPDVPAGASLGGYPVWAMDTGNGNIIRLRRDAVVGVLGDAYYLITKALTEGKKET